MTVNSFNEHEVEILVLALRYWRSQRPEGVTRRSDPFVAPDAVDLLLSKLGSRNPPAPELPIADDQSSH